MGIEMANVSGIWNFVNAVKQMNTIVPKIKIPWKMGDHVGVAVLSKIVSEHGDQHLLLIQAPVMGHRYVVVLGRVEEL